MYFKLASAPYEIGSVLMNHEMNTAMERSAQLWWYKGVIKSDFVAAGGISNGHLLFSVDC